MRPAQETFRDLGRTLICQPELASDLIWTFHKAEAPAMFSQKITAAIHNRDLDAFEYLATALLDKVERPGIVVYTLSGGRKE